MRWGAPPCSVDRTARAIFTRWQTARPLFGEVVDLVRHAEIEVVSAERELWLERQAEAKRPPGRAIRLAQEPKVVWRNPRPPQKKDVRNDEQSLNVLQTKEEVNKVNRISDGFSA